MIRYDMPAGEYHAHPARSKSYLWKLYAKTPGPCRAVGQRDK